MFGIWQVKNGFLSIVYSDENYPASFDCENCREIAAQKVDAHPPTNLIGSWFGTFYGNAVAYVFQDEHQGIFSSAERSGYLKLGLFQLTNLKFSKFLYWTSTNVYPRQISFYFAKNESGVVINTNLVGISLAIFQITDNNLRIFGRPINYGIRPTDLSNCEDCGIFDLVSADTSPDPLLTATFIGSEVIQYDGKNALYINGIR